MIAGGGYLAEYPDSSAARRCQNTTVLAAATQEAVIDSTVRKLDHLPEAA